MPKRPWVSVARHWCHVISSFRRGGEPDIGSIMTRSTLRVTESICSRITHAPYIGPMLGALLSLGFAFSFLLIAIWHLLVTTALLLSYTWQLSPLCFLLLWLTMALLSPLTCIINYLLGTMP